MHGSSQALNDNLPYLLHYSGRRTSLSRNWICADQEAYYDSAECAELESRRPLCCSEHRLFWLDQRECTVKRTGHLRNPAKPSIQSISMQRDTIPPCPIRPTSIIVRHSQIDQPLSTPIHDQQILKSNNAPPSSAPLSNNNPPNLLLILLRGSSASHGSVYAGFS